MWAATCPFFLLIDILGRAFSSCGGQGALFTAMAGSSPPWPLFLRSTGSRHTGFSGCSSRAKQLRLAGPGAPVQKLWCTDLVAPWPVWSSRTRDRTHVPWVGRQIPVHWTTREVSSSCSCSARPCKRPEDWVREEEVGARKERGERRMGIALVSGVALLK